MITLKKEELEKILIKYKNLIRFTQSPSMFDININTLEPLITDCLPQDIYAVNLKTVLIKDTNTLEKLLENSIRIIFQSREFGDIFKIYERSDGYLVRLYTITKEEHKELLLQREEKNKQYYFINYNINGVNYNKLIDKHPLGFIGNANQKQTLIRYVLVNYNEITRKEYKEYIKLF